MTILALNAGSSSLKFAVYAEGSSQESLSGRIERIDTTGTCGELEAAGVVVELRPDGSDHAAAIRCVLEAVTERLKPQGLSLAGIGHRVVHGGSLFDASALVDGDNLEKIRGLIPLAPLHNPANIAVIEAAAAEFPGLPQVAVFDTAFHQTLEEKVFRYAVPDAWYREHQVRRYGFHGTSHAYVSGEAIRRYGLDPDKSRVLVAHLGNGCSASAVVGGKCVDTTMGLSPLEGLVMGTRSGTLDPTLASYMERRAGMSLEEFTRQLNQESGLKGLSGVGSDMRELIAAANEGHEGAQLALDVFEFRLTKELCALLAALGGIPDALIFTGGIGENNAALRARVLENLGWMGFEVDAQANVRAKSGDGIITLGREPLAAVVPTNEELAIVQETRALIGA